MNVFTTIDSGVASILPFSDSEAAIAIFGAITHLGDARVIAVVGVSMAIVLWRRGRHSYWIGLGVSVLGALSTSWVVKMLIARPRPLESLIEVSGYSLPSMHAAVAAALYGYLIYVTLRLMHPPHHRAPWAATLFALMLFIGVSRVYLGVHYATDVIAGFVLGALWVYAGHRANLFASSRRGR